MSETVVSLKNINKQYWLSFGKQSLIGCFLSMFRAKKSIESKKEICALKDIEICIKKGEAVGIIGENASGKTTLLRIISRITVPTKGELRVNGKVAGLLDLGAGFHSELTGKENIYLDAALYGRSRKDIDVIYEKIVEFSGLGEFIDAQVKTYSQGMLVRLGFSIAIHVNPDIFLIDDSLAVGDEEFQRKCIKKVAELKSQGKTIIVVSHDLDSISRICERGILLKSGRIIKDDAMHTVIMRYIEAVGDKNSIAVVDKGRLSAIFNAGKIVLLWDGKPLTKNFGGYASLQTADKWVMSWQAKWKVINNNENFWKAEGVLSKYDIKFILECTVSSEFLLDFHLKIESMGSTELRKTGFGFMLSEKYDRFLKEEVVEDIETIQNLSGEWTDVYRTDECLAPLILISKGSLPVVKMKFVQDKFPSFSLIQNTLQDLDARVMQMQTIIPGRLKTDSSSVSQIIKYGLKLELLKDGALDNFIHERAQSGFITSKGLKLQVKQKHIRIFYNGTQLTKDKSLSFGFFYNQHFFNLFDGEWHINKESSDRLVVSSEFKDLKFSLCVVFQLEQQQLKWHVLIQGDDFTEKGSLLMQACFREQYDSYFDIAQEGVFSSASEHAEKIDLANQNSGFIGLTTSGGEIPHIIFESDIDSLIELQNASFDQKFRVLTSSCLNKDSLNGKIVLFDNQKQKSQFLAEKQKEYGFNTIGSGTGMRIEFEENRISLYKDNILITDGEGFCSGIFFNGRWHESKQLTKKFEKKGKTLKVIIRRKLPEVNEFWTIFFEEGAICWSVIVESSVPLPELCCKTGIILKPNYRQWVHSFHEGEFSDKVKDNQIIDSDDSNNILLGSRTNTSEAAFPVLFFERKHTANPRGIIIQGDGKSSMLMFKFETVDKNSKQKVFTGKIMLSEQNSWEDYISKHRLQHFSLMTDNGLQLISAFKEIRLLFNKKTLTEKCGLRVSLTAEDRKLDSKGAFWKIRKLGQDKIEVELTWKDFPILQKWCFRKDNEAIEWTVKLILQQRLKLTKLFINIFSDFTFNRWINGKEKGRINLRKFETESITLFEKRSNFIGVYRDAISTETPALLLNPLVDMNEWFLHLYACHRDEEMAWGAHCIIGPEGRFISSGDHEIFKARLLLLENEKKLIKSIVSLKSENLSEISNGNLTVKVEDAKVGLFWKGQELTKTLGLYSAFFYGKDWVDSSLAKWQVTVESDMIAASLSWNQFPFLQRWELSLSNEELSWVINMDIQRKDINSIIAALMLNDKYNHYQTDSVKGAEFPLVFSENRWEQLSLTKGGINVRADNENFPGITFKGLVPGYTYNNILENSDKLHSGRVLKCETKIIASEIKKNGIITSKVKIKIKD